MTSVASVKLNPVLDELGGYPLAALQQRVRSLRESGRPVIDFSLGDPREPTPEFIRESLISAVPAVSRYPTVRGLPELRQAIAHYVDRRFGVSVDADSQVIPTAGSKEAIFTTPLAFVDRDAGQLAVFGTPGYPGYERGARFAGAEAHPIRLEDDFVLSAAQIPDEAWDRARLAWICTPHNPTGAVTSLEELSALSDRARSSDTLLLSDECYADIYEDERPGSVLQVTAPDFTGTLAYFSCSKRSGMTGYRSGAIVGDAEAIAALVGFRSSVGVASPAFVQAAAIAAWSDDEHASERRQIFATKRAVVRKAFEEMGLEVVGSAAGLYIWLSVPDDLEATDRLLEEGIVVSPGRVFGSGGEGFIRLALVPTVDDCRSAVVLLEKCLT